MRNPMRPPSDDGPLYANPAAFQTFLRDRDRTAARVQRRQVRQKAWRKVAIAMGGTMLGATVFGIVGASKKR